MKDFFSNLWDDICDFFHDAACYYNAGHDMDEGRDPRESLQHLNSLKDVPDEIKGPKY
ncbi:MAG: hypothetical protein IJE43_04965 [Alphaproteobacteria bacterium]|nr:hypothetical protein [Alphaproteobacteria bacterium]